MVTVPGVPALATTVGPAIKSDASVTGILSPTDAVLELTSPANANSTGVPSYNSFGAPAAGALSFAPWFAASGAFGAIAELDVAELDGDELEGELITYCALFTRLRPPYGTIAIACSVVVELIATGPKYRFEFTVGVHPSVV